MRRLLAAALIAAAPVFAAAALAGCSSGLPPAAAGSRILLVTLDTTRADHLSAYGYARETSPSLARIAAGGVLFTRAYTNMPTTDPAHATFLTGLYPRRHGVTRNGMRAVAGAPSLAARLKASGLRTAAFVSRKHLDPRTLGVPGFDLVDVPSDKERRGSDTAAAARRWLRRQGEGAWFCWVHLFDPHAPYDPPPEIARRFGGTPPDLRLGVRGWLAAGDRHPGTVAANNVSLYDAEIAAADDVIGRLVSEAEALPGAPPLVVVLTDHGESLTDLEERFRYAFAHGEFLYDHQARMLVVVRRRGDLPEGRRVDALVEGVDVAPTILDLAGDDPDLGGDGVSRAGLVRGGAGSGAEAVFLQRRSFAEPEQPWLAADEYAVVRGAWKYIVNRLKDEELYDLGADPAESDNLAARRPEVASALKEAIRAWLASHPAAPAEGETDPDAEKLKDLRSLGYVD